MEGLDEMKSSEKIGERFVPKTFVTDEGQVVIDRLKAEKKERKLAFKQKMKEDQQAREARVTREKELVPA